MQQIHVTLKGMVLQFRPILVQNLSKCDKTENFVSKFTHQLLLQYIVT